MLVKHVNNRVIYKIYDIRQSHELLFLIYVDGEWTYSPAYLYEPCEDNEND